MISPAIFPILLFISTLAHSIGASKHDRQTSSQAVSDSIRIYVLHHKFEDYPVPPYTGKYAPINWKSNPHAKRFKTVITQGVHSGANFAGHYCIVEWGCGTMCQSWVIVDLITGKIFDGIPASRGLDYRPNSRLLILDPPYENGQWNDAILGPPEVYEWSKNKLHLLEKAGE
jgi:hypothetical protein